MLSTMIAAMTDPEGASFFGYIGIACALVFANLGAAYGTAKSGVGVCSMGVLKPDQIIKSVIPVIMAGILGIYGLIVAVILSFRKSHLTLMTLITPMDISKAFPNYPPVSAVD